MSPRLWWVSCPDGCSHWQAAASAYQAVVLAARSRVLGGWQIIEGRYSARLSGSDAETEHYRIRLTTCLAIDVEHV